MDPRLLTTACSNNNIKFLLKAFLFESSKILLSGFTTLVPQYIFLHRYSMNTSLVNNVSSSKLQSVLFQL